MEDLSMFTKLFEYGLLGAVLAGVGYIGFKLGSRALDIITNHLKENNAIHKEFCDRTDNHFKTIDNKLISIDDKLEEFEHGQQTTNQILTRQNSLMEQLCNNTNGKHQ